MSTVYATISTQDDNDQGKDDSNPAESERPSAHATEVLNIVRVSFVDILRGNDDPKDNGNDEDNNQDEEKERCNGPAVHFFSKI